VGYPPASRGEVDTEDPPPHITYSALKASEEPTFKRFMLKEHGTLHVVDLPNQSPGFLDPTHFRGEGTRPLKKPGEGIWYMLHFS
jgi:hypothetical protein